MSSAGKRRFTDDDDDDDEDMELRRGPWTLEEDTLLIHYIACHGEGRWDMLAKCSGLKRTGKSCRLRWLNYLKPDVKRGNLTLEEQVLILELHSKLGNRWSRIAQHLPGRTDNEIKNYWRTRVQKQARQLKIDANSSRFRDAIRCIWMPRMLQKIEESSRSSSSTMNPQVPSTPLQTSSLSVLPPPLPIQGCYSHQEYNSTNSEKCTSPSMSANELLLCRQQQLCHEGVRLESMSAMPGLENSISDCHEEDNDWANIEVADNLWNMDELWQFSMS